MGVKVKYRDGAWWVFVHHLGQRKAKKVGDKETAQRVAQAVREQIARRGLTLPPASGEQSLRTFAGSWLAAQRGNLKASTLAFYEGNLERHILRVLGNRQLRSIDRADCVELIADCRARGLKVNTIIGIVRTLSTVLSEAMEATLLPANPALRLGKFLRRGDEPQGEPDPFTQAEAEILAAVAAERFPEWYPWVLMGLRTGLRAGELLGVQWSDVDWRGRFIQVQRSLVRGVETTPKNHQRRRVDLSPQLRAELRRWRAQQSTAWLARGHQRPAWVFPSSTGTALDESKARKAFNQILDKAGLHRRGPHQMRHTFASLLLGAGVPITYVSKQLGHRDAAITLRVYAHCLPDAGGERGVDQLDTDAPGRNPYATKVAATGDGIPRKLLKKNGEPPGTRTPNPQIKSLLLCQLS